MYTSDDEQYAQHSHDCSLNGERQNIVDMQFTASAFVLSAPVFENTYFMFFSDFKKT